MNNKKKRSKLIAILVAILAVLVVVAVLLAKGGKDGGSSNADNEVEQVMESGIKVETTYGDFFISDEWFDYFEYEINDKDNYEVVFKAVYEKSEAELFTLVFAEKAEGSLLGSIEADGKTANVFMQLEEIEIPEDLPAEKHDAFYGMQEEVNSIIEQLNQMKEFTPAE